MKKTQEPLPRLQIHEHRGHVRVGDMDGVYDSMASFFGKVVELAEQHLSYHDIKLVNGDLPSDVKINVTEDWDTRILEMHFTQTRIETDAEYSSRVAGMEFEAKEIEHREKKAQEQEIELMHQLMKKYKMVY